MILAKARSLSFVYVLIILSSTYALSQSKLNLGNHQSHDPHQGTDADHTHDQEELGLCEHPLTENYDEKKSEYYIVDGWVEDDESELYESKAAKTVYVDVWADELFINHHGNWQNYTSAIIEDADNAFWRDFNINLNVSRYFTWYVNRAYTPNASSMLSHLNSVASGYRPKGLAIGFTKDEANFLGTEGGLIAGIAYVYPSNPGFGAQVLLDQGYGDTVKTLRHELGHNYGLGHDANYVVCIMSYGYAYTVDYFHAAHKNLINNHQYWFTP